MGTLGKKNKREELEKIFKEKKVIKKDQFVLNCFNNGAILGYFEKLGKEISKFTDGIEKKYKVSTIKLPLDKTSEFETAQVPSSIFALCNSLGSYLKQKNFEISNELHTLNDEELILCESIVNAISTGYTKEIDFSEISFILILNTLKVILKSLPESLFTEIVSRKLLSVDPESIEREKILKRAIEKIPLCNYKPSVVFPKFFTNCSKNLLQKLAKLSTPSLFVLFSKQGIILNMKELFST